MVTFKHECLNIRSTTTSYKLYIGSTITAVDMVSFRTYAI